MLASIIWNAASHWPLALGAGLLALTLVLWFYPGQTRNLSRRWQVLLPMLRLTAMLCLAISLLKPTLVRPRTEEENGAVVVLVDRSASMAVSDSQLSPAERVALAGGLGALPADRRKLLYPGAAQGVRALRRSLDRLARATADLEYAKLSGRSLDQRNQELASVLAQVGTRAGELAGTLAEVPLDGQLQERVKILGHPESGEGSREWVRQVGEVVAALDELLRNQQEQADRGLYEGDEAVRTASDRLTSSSRLELAERALLDEKTGLLNVLSARIPVFGFTMAEMVRGLPLRSGSTVARRLLTEADGAQTRIEAGILGALEQLRGRPARAVVLLTDGRSTGDGELRSQVMGTGVPVFPVTVGRERSIRDLAITSLRMPESAYAGESVNLHVELASRNMPAGEYPVRLTAGERHEEKRVYLEPGGTGAVDFAFRAGAGNGSVESVRVDAIGRADEATQANNSVRRLLKVIQGKLNILMVSSQASWEYQYVRNALERTPWATVTAMRLDEEGGVLGIAPSRLADYDVICLLGVDAASLTPSQVDTLYRSVTQKGVSVVLVPGDGRCLESWSRDVLLSELLPYRAGGKAVWRSWPGDLAAFKMQPPEDPVAASVTALADDPALSRLRWGSLPAVYHYLAIGPLKSNVVRTLLVEKGSHSPVLVESRLGLGRVLFVGIDETWRWRLRVGERDQDRFWLGLIRHVAEGPYALVTPGLALDVDHLMVHPGEAVKVRIRVTNSARPPVVELRQNGKLIRQEPSPTALEDRSGHYELMLQDLPVGDLEVVAREQGNAVGAGPEDLALRLPVEVGYPMDRELADVSADPAAMRQLASVTGGLMLPVEQIGELAGRLENLPNREGSSVEIPLWSGGYLYLIVLACLAAEWAIRKRVGLA